MGVDKAMWAARDEDATLRFVDGQDKTIASFPAGDKVGLVKKLEVMRTELVGVPYERTREGVEGLLGDCVREVRQDGEGLEAPRVLRTIAKRGSDFYGQEIAQAKCKSISNGRVVLLGDAGYCPSPLSGEGTSLALVGAYILAGYVATYPDVSEALAKYEEMVQPFVKSSHSLPPGVPWIVNPQTATGISILNNVVWLAGLAVQTGIFKALGKLGALVPSFGSKPLVLPEFAALGSIG